MCCVAAAFALQQEGRGKREGENLRRGQRDQGFELKGSLSVAGHDDVFYERVLLSYLPPSSAALMNHEKADPREASRSH